MIISIGPIGPIGPVLYRSGPKSVLRPDRGLDGPDRTVNIPMSIPQIYISQIRI